MFPVEVEYRGDPVVDAGVAGELVRRVRSLPQTEHVAGGARDEDRVHLIAFVRALTALGAEGIVRRGLYDEPPIRWSGRLRCEAVIEARGRLRELPG